MGRFRMRLLTLSAVLAFTHGVALANTPTPTCAALPTAASPANQTFFVDPVNGSDSNDGSEAKPFKSLEFVLNPANRLFEVKQNKAAKTSPVSLQLVNPGARIKSGATLNLKTGNYGAVTLSNLVNDQFVTIRAAAGARPEFTRLELRGVNRFILDGLRVRAASATTTGNLVSIVGLDKLESSNVVLRNMDVAAVNDVSRYTPAQWLALKTTGMMIDAECSRVLNNTVANVRVGMELRGEYTTADSNKVTNFADDGIRFVNNNQTIRRNVVQSGRNALADNGLHDAIQGMMANQSTATPEGLLKNILIERNVVVNFQRTGYRPMRGIGYYQGAAENVSVTNNLVLTDSPNGITLLGARGATVAHNTVLGTAVTPSTNTAITLADRSPAGSVLTANAMVFNNIADTFSVAPTRLTNNIATRSIRVEQSPGRFVTLANDGAVATAGNTRVIFVNRLFEDATKLRVNGDPLQGNYRLKAGSPAIDTGSTRTPLPVDLLGNARSGAPDLGAFNFAVTTTTSPTTGGSGGGSGGSGNTGTEPPVVQPDQPSTPTANEPPVASSTTPVANTCPTADGMDNFVTNVKLMGEEHPHANNALLANEHHKLLDLVPRIEATFVAVRSGSWNDAKTWHRGCYPTAGARVLIPAGITVTFDTMVAPALQTMRVDGTLKFATNMNTQLVLDTMVVTGTGRLQIGTAEQPIQPNVTAKILFTNTGDINVAKDPALMSRGVLSHGEVSIYGARKTPFLKVAEAPLKGQTRLRLAAVPEGWRVGDELVITGTKKKGHMWPTFVPSEDEVVKIVAINGTQVTFDKPLAYDHTTPRADLFAYVANLTRNVVFTGVQGAATPVHQRGHVMFMHNDNVDVRYAGFYDLGRTDKRQPAFDVGKLPAVLANSNVKGRYPFHFHRTGTANQMKPALAIGNVAARSFGWGFAHHSSHAHFVDNVTFDIFGAGYAAEDGDETGIWYRNIAIKSQGRAYGDWAVKNGEDVARHDNGRTGEGFFFAGRLVRAMDNVAANVTHGYVWMTRSAPSRPLVGNLEHPEVAYGQAVTSTVAVDRVPIRGFHNNEAFGTSYGVIVIKPNANQGHDVRTVMDKFLNWETSVGADITYTSHYTLKDFDIIATKTIKSQLNPKFGIGAGTNTYDLTLVRPKIDGMPDGIRFGAGFVYPISDSNVQRIAVDPMVTNSLNAAFAGFVPGRHAIVSSSNLVPDRLTFELSTPKVITKVETMYLEGTKTDSVGSYALGFGAPDMYHQGRKRLDSVGHVRPWLASQGSYTTPDGRKVALLEDLIADRVTGDLRKIAHVYELKPASPKALSFMPDRGPIKLGTPAPVAGADAASTLVNRPVVINVLANDRDPDGKPVRVDGMNDPRYGDVFVQADGKIMYRPYFDFVGTDRFSYWVTDGEGNFTKAAVTVNVTR